VYGNTALRHLAVTACSVALAAGLAGCSDSVEPTGGLAIVVGARNNMPPASLTGKAEEAREDALVSQAYLSVVVADGAPFQMDGAGVLVARDENAVVQKQDRDRNRQAIDAMLAEARAETPETDLLAAIDKGARSITSSPGTRRLVVVDSGLSTSGTIDFVREPDLLDADASDLADRLRQAKALPDLRDTTVVFQGLGDTVLPQRSLGLSRRANLVDIWVAVAKAAGAGEVLVEHSPLDGQPAAGLPWVTPVEPGADVSCKVETMELDEGDVAFEADSAGFKDPAEARETLTPIAHQMKRDNLLATLTGTTANVGDEDGQVDLSEQRARAVLDLLVALGVPAHRLTAVGLGSDFSGYVEDRDAEGQLIPEAAAGNRKVIIELFGSAGGVSCG
jgi:outer membrane protein OmpA-like peptidoglycan-associated protein